jgi:V/A-type H+-transporting ATPase subunit E
MYLEVKQEAVNIAVRITVTEISNMSKEESLEFMTKAVVEAGVSEGELKLNKKDKEAIGEALVKRVNQEMVDGKIVLSDETIKEQGGFLLKRGKMEVNSTIETMVNAIKSDVTPEVVATLF